MTQWTRQMNPTALPGDEGGLEGFRPAHLDWSVEDGVGTVTLRRPHRKNALTFESYGELRELFTRLSSAPEVRAVVLTGAEGEFSSGGDVFEIIGRLVQTDMPGLLRFTRMTTEVVRQMRRCPQPLVAAVDGVCAGAGAALALACDLRVGTPRARVGFLFTRVGLAGCDMGACALLPRVVGMGRAAELLYTGRMMDAQEAERWGFFNRVVPPEELLERARSLARELAAGPAFAVSMTKRMLLQEWAMGVDEALEAEAQAQAICMATQDFDRGYRAFATRSKPEFRGD
ncbi:MAG: enoyl-CoA hydratase family protein [Armatimonadota bacterium]|nr:enoyl-CoA hydratase family protein [Armatimonadota bacterium]MDW8156999.1 enoyl-CoA hydratase family protein [Armatimonadota bacterium]